MNENYLVVLFICNVLWFWDSGLCSTGKNLPSVLPLGPEVNIKTWNIPRQIFMCCLISRRWFFYFPPEKATTTEKFFCNHSTVRASTTEKRRKFYVLSFLFHVQPFIIMEYKKYPQQSLFHDDFFPFHSSDEYLFFTFKLSLAVVLCCLVWGCK